MATSNNQTPQKTATTNPNTGSHVEAHYTPQDTLFFRPETEEFIMVLAKDMTSLENDCRRLDMIISNYHDANIKLEAALDASRHQIFQSGKTPVPAQQAKQELEHAYKKAMDARKALYGELKALSKLDTGRASMMELIPVAASPDNKWLQGKKMTYVSPKESSKIKSHWRTYSLRGDQTKSANKSFIKKDENGNSKYDKEEFRKGVTTLKTKFKTEWFKVDEHNVQFTLFDWADAWNKDLKYDFAKNNPHSVVAKYIDVTASAQLMRYMGGVGLATEFDPLKGNCAIKASARAEFAVAEGKAVFVGYLPDKVGWILEFDGDDKQTYPLGAIRFRLEVALSGSVGASVVAEASLSVDLIPGKGDKQADVFGVKGAPTATPQEMKRSLKINGKPIDPGAAAELNAFAGAKADAKIAGSLQWLNPQDMTADYQDFAKVGPSLGLSAGAGAGCIFELTYVLGKFRFKMMAAACLGLGAKGKLELEVDAKLIAQFAGWFIYQLYNANFMRLNFIEQLAYDNITYMWVLIVDNSMEGCRKLEDFVGKEAKQIARSFSDLVDALDAENKRVQLMETILSAPDVLLSVTPEAKGIMLFQLTRHDWKIDGMDNRNHGDGYYSERKRAVKVLLSFAHTKRDFDNIVQHMTPMGVAGDKVKNKAHVVAFLEMDIFGKAKQGEEMENYYDNLHASLKDAPTVGYPLCRNDSIQYAVQMNGDDLHPVFASVQNTEFNIT